MFLRHTVWNFTKNGGIDWWWRNDCGRMMTWWNDCGGMIVVEMCYHNRVSTTRYTFLLRLPHTDSTSGTDCVGLTIIVPLRGTARSTRQCGSMRHRCARLLCGRWRCYACRNCGGVETSLRSPAGWGCCLDLGL